MYPVSSAYKTKISQSNIYDEITGTIVLTDNTIINFTDEDLKENSFYFKESCVAGQTLEFGNVNSSLLVLTLFTDLENIYSLDGAMIKPVYRLELDNGSFEEVPLGTFFVTKIERQDDAVKLEAMDGMVLLGKSVLGVSTTGKARDIILSLCSKCGVELITNGTTFSTFPNYSVELALPTESKVETCLDLLMWVCSSIGCSARFDRTGKLEIRLVTGGAASKVVSADEQMLTKLSDFSSKISGISYDKTIIGNETGIVLKQDANPLWSDKKESQTTSFLTNILNRITLAEYVAGNTEIWGDPAIQAGDYITLEETSKGDVKILVTSHSWHYRGKHSITSAGTSNKVAGIYSQGEKRILSATKKAEKAEKTATLAEEKTAELEELVETTRADFDTAIGVLDGEMGSVTAQIGELETDINGIQAEYSTLHAEIYDTARRMTEAETEISIVAGQITSKVSQDEYDEYVSITGDTITQIESDLSLIEQTASNISATVSSHTGQISGLDSRLTSAQAKIDVHADQISQTVTKTEFNNLQIGGTNLLPHNPIFWEQGALLAATGQPASNPTRIRTKNYIPIVSSDTIISKYCDCQPLLYFYDNANNLIGTNGWVTENQRVVVVPAGAVKFKCVIRKPDDSNITIDILSEAKIKFEKGTKATDWSPAPEDVDSAIATVDGKFTNYYTKTQSDSQITQLSDQIALRVETSTYTSGMNSKANQSALNTTNSNLSSLTARVSSAELKITDSAIVQTVTASSQYTSDLAGKATTESVSALSATVTTNATSVTTAFKTIGVSGYTRTGKTVISASGLTVYDGALTIKNTSGTDVFKADADGNLDITGKITATSGSFTGSVTSSVGAIGGWELASNILKSGTGNNGVVLKSAGTVRFAAGLPRSLIDAGSSAIDQMTGSITTYLTSTGYFKCSNADITGNITATSITATSGTIGGWTIASSALTRDDDLGYMRLGGAGWAISMGSTTPASAPLRMTYAGYLYASNATIAGKITATSGDIGDWNISNGALVSSTGMIVAGTLTNGVRIRDGQLGFYTDSTLVSAMSVFSSSGYNELRLGQTDGAAINLLTPRLRINYNDGLTTVRTIGGVTFTWTNGILTGIS